MMKKTFRSKLLIATTLLASCGSWAGNPNDKKPEPTPSGILSLDLTGVTGTQLVGSIDVTGKDGQIIGSLTLDHAQIALAGLQLKMANEASEPSREKFDGPFVLDLITNSFSPTAKAINVEPGLYNDVVLKLHELEPDTAGGINCLPQLLDNSIYMSGTWTPLSGESVPFSMTQRIGEEFSLAGSTGAIQGVTIIEGENPLLVAFDLGKWFDFGNSITSKNVDLTSLSGPIVLGVKSEGAAQNIMAVIKNNIKRSGDFGLDRGKTRRLERKSR